MEGEYEGASMRIQKETEELVKESLGSAIGADPLDCMQLLCMDVSKLVLNRAAHIKFLRAGLESLPNGFAALDASRPWLCYWILHSLSILDALPEPSLLDKVAIFLDKCQDVNGGFAGGPGQDPHLAPTYAAVNALVIIGSPLAFDIINRKKLLGFLMRRKHPSGGFTLHEGGEVDARGCYCALSAAFLTGILTPELKEGVAEYIASCQTYEGGIGGEPDNEAHGGYSFCGYAAMLLTGKQLLVDRSRMLRWVTSRQMNAEGGFQGRANKLVDGCYSFWQGSLVSLLSMELKDLTVVPIASCDDEKETRKSDHSLCDTRALQLYILAACQDPAGGLRDKPSIRRDFYHSCYCLSGLSIAQYSSSSGAADVVGPETNKVAMVDVVLNVEVSKAAAAVQYFHSLPLP